MIFCCLILILSFILNSFKVIVYPKRQFSFVNEKIFSFIQIKIFKVMVHIYFL